MWQTLSHLSYDIVKVERSSFLIQSLGLGDNRDQSDSLKKNETLLLACQKSIA